MSLVFPSSHPLVHHHVMSLRDTRTRPPEFRRLVRCLATLLVQDATADLATRAAEVPTPLGIATGRTLADTVAIVPILRAGLGMVEGILDMIPEAEVWHLGLYRNEETLRPMEYYRKLPARPRATVALVVDPMLATGGSSLHACRILRGAGFTRLKVVALIAAPEGIRVLSEAMPDVQIHVAAIDDHLNAIGYIYPGLGDAGDRQFGTSET